MRLSAVVLTILITLSLAYNPSLPLRDCVVHQFPKGSWLGNIAVQSNGNILVTQLIPSVALYQITNPTSFNPTVSLFASFPSVNGILGIAETRQDVFTVIGGNFSGIATPVIGTFGAWNVAFGHTSGSPGSAADNPFSPSPTVSFITSIESGAFLNGMVALPKNSTTVLIFDSAAGVVYSLDTLTGRYTIAISLPQQMGVPAGAPLAIVINGIDVFNDRLYWTNSFQKTIYHVSIDAMGAVPKGATVEKLATITEAIFLDDFAFDADGTMFVADGPGNRIFAVRQSGSYELFDGKATQLNVAGGTSGAFGMGKADQRSLYLTTSGGLSAPVNGTIVEGAKVVAIDTTGN